MGDAATSVGFAGWTFAAMFDHALFGDFLLILSFNFRLYIF